MEHLQNIDAPAIPHHVQLLGSQLLLHQQLILEILLEEITVLLLVRTCNGDDGSTYGSN